jgi:2-haloacid dehalogenase
MQLPGIKYVTFDCYGTLTWFQINDVTAPLVADRIDDDCMTAFLTDYSAFRRDEVLGSWKPYAEVLGIALERTCRLWNVPFRGSDAVAIYAAVPTWGPHPDVVAPLKKIAAHIPLVILSNASNDQIGRNVDLLRAPFHAIYTAEQAQAYKPCLTAFEYMFDQLGCSPADVAHVSASMRYDLMSAHDLRIPHRIYINRGYEPSNPFYSTVELESLKGLPGALGLE